MRISVQADEGDEVSISADFISVEQATVTLEIENTSYDSQPELESVTLSIDKARELAKGTFVRSQMAREPSDAFFFGEDVREALLAKLLLLRF